MSPFLMMCTYREGMSWRAKVRRYPTNIGENLNSTTGDLGGDGKSLEERCLLGTHGRDLGGDEHIDGGNSSGLGWGLDLVLKADVAGYRQIALGEHEANVAADNREQLLECGVLVQVPLDDLADHGVLAHEHLASATQLDAGRRKEQRIE